MIPMVITILGRLAGVNETGNIKLAPSLTLTPLWAFVNKVPVSSNPVAKISVWAALITSAMGYTKL